MRPIKFRVWDKSLEEMRYSINIPSDYTERNGSLDLINMFQTLNQRYVFMQYTGLKDCHGREIYEGDTVLWKRIIYENCSREKIDRIEIHEGEIVWFKNAWHLKKGRFYMPLFWFDEEKDEMEVKGNSFENPELLRE